MDRPLYNFRIAPEAIWLVVNTVAGTLLVDLIGRFSGLETFPTIDELQAWLPVLAVAAVRTLLGAILAATTGQFLKPGEVPTKPASG